MLPAFLTEASAETDRGGLEIIDLGLADYRAAWKKQKRLVRLRSLGACPDTVLFVEHPSVYTRGTSGRGLPPARLPAPLYDVERGGGVTYHGPGQLVGYPILHLRERALSVGAYLRGLEDCLISACATLGLRAQRIKGFTGVWARDKKIASIGVAVREWTTYHGFALNVDPDLSHFSHIHPCGLEPEQISSLSLLLDRKVTRIEARNAVADALRRGFPLVSGSMCYNPVAMEQAPSR